LSASAPPDLGKLPTRLTSQVALRNVERRHDIGAVAYLSEKLKV
jgi:hypothetical protein